MKIDKSRDKVEAMFDSIAPSYDLLNHLLSMNIDKLWRRRVVKILKKRGVTSVLDVATGTADLSIAIASSIKEAKIKGVDISEGMLSIGRKKVQQRGLEGQITLERGDGLALPFEDGTFDAVTISMGIRNFENLEKGLSEMFRVLKKDGVLVVLELSTPHNPLFRFFFHLYCFKIMPLIGRLKSKNSTAYTYLPTSVKAFTSGRDFLDVMEKCGFKSLKMRSLSGGISTIYLGVKDYEV